MNIGSIKKVAGRSLLLAKKYAPEILTTVGIVGGVTSAVMASRATLKLEPVVAKLEEGLDTVKELKVIALADGEFDQRQHTKDVVRVYARGTFDIVKLYGPSVSLGIASIACVVSAHGIMRQRNAALIGAYKILEHSYSEYRKRVIEEFGEDKDRDYRLGLFDEEVVDEETGKKKKVTRQDPNAISQHARFFDEGNINWDKRPEWNQVFLISQQNHANDILHARGHIFLNEVYDMLGLEHSQSGALIGWVMDRDEDVFDSFVDFGIFDPSSMKAREFVNLQERSILLNFNVGGVIFDKI